MSLSLQKVLRGRFGYHGEQCDINMDATARLNVQLKRLRTAPETRDCHSKTHPQIPEEENSQEKQPTNGAAH